MSDTDLVEALAAEADRVGLKQDGLAKALGISQKTISRWFAKKKRPVKMQGSNRRVVEDWLKRQKANGAGPFVRMTKEDADRLWGIALEIMAIVGESLDRSGATERPSDQRIPRGSLDHLRQSRVDPGQAESDEEIRRRSGE